MQIREPQLTDQAQRINLISKLGYEISSDDFHRQLAIYTGSEVSVLLVAEVASGELVGFVGGHVIPLIHEAGSLGRITALVVASGARGSGVGSELLAYIEAWFHERGCIRIEVTSSDRRHAAHEFYKSRGYVQDERRFIKRDAT